MKEINYYVIGGQHTHYCYGGTSSLTEAKLLAGKKVEYWGNIYGWHVPAIYKAEDTIARDDFYDVTRCPKDGASPIAWGIYVSASDSIAWTQLGF